MQHFLVGPGSEIFRYFQDNKKREKYKSQVFTDIGPIDIFTNLAVTVPTSSTCTLLATLSAATLLS